MTIIKGSLFLGCILSDLSKCSARSLLQTIQTIDIVSCYAAKPDKIALPLFLIFRSHLITI
ncbi:MULTISPECIES: hypothetical protein, partial [unclassified Microcoleus]